MIFINPVVWKDFRSSHQFSIYCLRLIVNITCHLVSHDNLLGGNFAHFLWTDQHEKMLALPRAGSLSNQCNIVRCHAIVF